MWHAALAAFAAFAPILVALPDPAPLPLVRPDIRVSMTVTPAEAKVGDKVTFTVRVSNEGSAASAGVNVLDKFPPQLSDVMWTCTSAGETSCKQSSGNGSIALDGVTMAAGSSLELMASTVLSQIPPSGAVSNQVAAQDSTGGEDADPADNFAQATVRAAGLVTTMAATPATVNAGDQIAYTVTLTNPGAAAYAGASFSSDLSDLLADATLNNDFKASDGSAVAYTSPELSWTGTIAPQSTVAITYSVTVKDANDQQLNVSAASPGCLDAGRCRTSIPVLVARITKSTSASAAKPGEAVTYTIDVTNTGAASYPAAEFAEDLTGILDSATLTGPAQATIGTVSYTAPNLRWTGDLPPGETARITYTVTVTDGGDALLSSQVTPARRMVCELCAGEVRIARLSQEISVVPSEGLVAYQVKLSNQGKAPFLGASYVNDLTEVLDDATLKAPPTASSGSIEVEPPKLTWSGDVAPGETVTLTYSVQTRGDLGDGVLHNVVTSSDTNCKTTDARCESTWTAPGAAPQAMQADPDIGASDESPVTGHPIWKLVAIGLGAVLGGVLLLNALGWIRREA